MCLLTFKLFFFEEFLTEASTGLIETDRLPKNQKKKKKKKKKRKDCTLHSSSVMHEKKGAKNDDAFRCSREVL